jgi:hypothetical protein
LRGSIGGPDGYEHAPVEAGPAGSEALKAVNILYGGWISERNQLTVDLIPSVRQPIIAWHICRVLSQDIVQNAVGTNGEDIVIGNQHDRNR